MALAVTRPCQTDLHFTSPLYTSYRGEAREGCVKQATRETRACYRSSHAIASRYLTQGVQEPSGRRQPLQEVSP